MIIQHKTCTLTGAAQALGSFVTAAGKVKQLILHADTANANVILVGGNSITLDATEYGFRIEKPVTTIPPAPTVLEAANLDLASIFVLGTNTEKFHMMVIYC